MPKLCDKCSIRNGSSMDTFVERADYCYDYFRTEARIQGHSDPKQNVTLRHSKMYTHTKFGITTSANIVGDVFIQPTPGVKVTVNRK